MPGDCLCRTQGKGQGGEGGSQCCAVCGGVLGCCASALVPAAAKPRVPTQPRPVVYTKRKQARPGSRRLSLTSHVRNAALRGTGMRSCLGGGSGLGTKQRRSVPGRPKLQPSVFRGRLQPGPTLEACSWWHSSASSMLYEVGTEDMGDDMRSAALPTSIPAPSNRAHYCISPDSKRPPPHAYRRRLDRHIT